jgi:hypothetical protein
MKSRKSFSSHLESHIQLNSPIKPAVPLPLCSGLFNQDTIKEFAPDTTVSHNLFNLKNKFEGVEGLAAGLNSNTHVSSNPRTINP